MSIRGVESDVSDDRVAQQKDAAKQSDDVSFIVNYDDRILITGGAGFIGFCVVENLLQRGFRNLVCLTRPSSDVSQLDALVKHKSGGVRIELLRGNLLSRADCENACRNATVIFHLAAGTGEKSFPDAFMNSVVATRNLLDASLQSTRLKRLVLVSSFTVYSNRESSMNLTESSPTETHPELRDAYCFAKVKQEEIVREYGKKFGIPHVVVRPGAVYGKGHTQITGRVGLGTFGLFLHLGGSNTIPFTYVENCADAIALAGLVKDVNGEVFNIVDDDLPSSRHFLRSYKKRVRHFKSVYVPHAVSFGLCHLWEKYSNWSHGQLPPVFNRKRWYVEWRKTRYSNRKIKERLGWVPKVPTATAMSLYFESCAQGKRHA